MTRLESPPVDWDRRFELPSLEETDRNELAIDRRMEIQTWILAGVVVLLWGLRVVGLTSTGSIFTIFAVAGALIGLAVIGLSPWLARQARGSGIVSWAIVGVSVGLFVAWSIAQVHLGPGYGTDEVAFDSYAAHLALSGTNPYSTSMAPAFPLYQVSPDGFTWHFSGTPVTSLSYPALSFLVYIPLMLFGNPPQAAIWLNVGAWGLTIILMAILVPRRFRAISLVIGSLSIYVAYAVGGVTDVLFIPLLLGCVVDLDEYWKVLGVRSLLSPVLFGLAMSLKQTPWLLAPFFAVIIYKGARSDGVARPLALARLVRYGLVAGLVFFAINGYWLALNPQAWLRGVLTPFSSTIVPGGQGLIALALNAGIGGGSVAAYSLLSYVVILILLFATAYYYPRGRWAVLLIPGVSLFFATRSFGSYFFELIPVAVVASLTWQHRGGGVPRSLRWLYLAGVAFLGTLAWVVLAPHPVTIRISGVHTTGQLATVDRISLQVYNSTSRPIQPSYTINLSGSDTAFWNLIAGPKTVAPHRGATVVIAAPNFPAEPSIAGGFQVVALTTGPRSVDASPLYQPQLLHLALLPDAIDKLIPSGTPVVVRAELLNVLDQRVSEANVPVYLGQAVYAQRGLEYGTASINGSNPGETPVSALTDANGVATFVVVDKTPVSDPLSLEANLVNTSDFYPYGYSQILPIRFSGVVG